MNSDCPFDEPGHERVFHEDGLIRCVWDAFAVTKGHALVLTRRHIGSWFETTQDEKEALLRGIEICREQITRLHHPNGFNIGVNVNEAAGQTIDHVHVHVIPRYHGDVADPRGGVRYVIPEKANYLVRDTGEIAFTPTPDRLQNLSSGPANPLLPKLLADLDRAVAADIAVAFTLDSGVQIIQPHLEDLIARDGRLRFLTGDYLFYTDPVALRKLLDLTHNRDLRVFESQQEISFHPKVYILHFPDGQGRAYIGSSNLSATALRDGVEWNFRVLSSSKSDDFSVINREFKNLFQSERTVELDHGWIDSYESRRKEKPVVRPMPIPPEPMPDAPKPHAIQREALNAIEASRAAGNRAGLAVLATGLGKTWLSAFDTRAAGAKRVLFVAHREEILDQATATFRKIRPDAHLGRFTGKEKEPSADVLFASIQTLGRLPHLRTFQRDAFDYIIIDEFHHAAARTYRNLINYFDCDFLLGLTATPERTDGGDLMSLCGENVLFRCDLFEGIERELLSPFRYFGVPDNVDYSNIPWRSARFDPDELDAALATQARAQNAYEQWQDKGGKRTLAFCCSKRHAQYMSDYFAGQGIKSAAVYSGPDSAPRAASLEALARGDIEILCAVDMFNEGVDVPNIDTVLMLRPTESAILWTQQVGRGLRRADGKDKLSIIDYIGNHRIFLNKPRSLLGVGASDSEMRIALSQIRDGTFELPPGCEVTYELEAREILESLLKPPPRGSQVVEAYYADYRERIGDRPLALEAFHDGYNPRQTGRKRWLQFVKDMGDLSGDAAQAYTQHQDFLDALEVTPMTKSFKMVLLLAAMGEDLFPGSISIEQLIDAVRRIVGRRVGLREEFGAALDDDDAMRQLLEKNPINAWASGRGTSGNSYFTYSNGVFATAFECAEPHRAPLQEMTRELLEWRLADYQARLSQLPAGGEFVCKVIHAGGRPIIKLPDRAIQPNLPMDWTPVSTPNGKYEAKFVKIAINVMREPGGDTNVLPSLMRSWFGPDAGLPGTNFRVLLANGADGYEIRPHTEKKIGTRIELWSAYAREQIPGFFGLEFSTGRWNQGFVAAPGHVFLLVTLEKSDMAADHRYEDHFESSTVFAWQSQNRTMQESKHGRLIKNHETLGVAVHLFIRKTKKIKNRAAPFIYCGELKFQDWHDDQPISVRWRLTNELPKWIQGL